MNHRYIDFVPKKRTEPTEPVISHVVKVNIFDPVEETAEEYKDDVFEELVSAPASEFNSADEEATVEDILEDVAPAELVEEPIADPTHEAAEPEKTAAELIEEPLEAEPLEAEPLEAEPIEAESLESELVEPEPLEVEPLEAESEKIEPESKSEIDTIESIEEELPNAKTFETQSSAAFGVFEDYVPIDSRKAGYYAANFEKRPLSEPARSSKAAASGAAPVANSSAADTSEAELKAAKAEKILKRPDLKSGLRSEKGTSDSADAKSSEEKAKSEPKSTIQTPRFINTHNIEKRPLSKTNYQARAEAPKNVLSDPVTIVDRPENESRLGLILTIIFTIVLGAAVGTIAFLLMPK